MAHLFDVAFLWLILLNFYSIFIKIVFPVHIGGILNTDKTLDILGHPYQITEELVVNEKATLRIDQGVMLEFSPGVGITVFGALITKGAPSNPVVMTKANKDISNPIKQRKSRLVDGRAVNEGRLQLWYNNRWRSVCTHSTNWTDTDIRVACQDLGYSRGMFYKWYLRNNDSFPLMYDHPMCRGTESSLMDCNSRVIRIGSGYCDEHMDIGIHCDGIQMPEGGIHWRGIQFLNARFKTQYTFNNKYRWNQSESILEYTSLDYGGVNLDGNSASVIESTGVPPILKNILVRWSLFNAVNFTHLNGEVDIHDSSFTENRGHGISINSTKGMVRLLNVSATQNLGNGIQYYYNDSFPKYINNFCDQSTFSQNQIYPLILTGKQNEETGLKPTNISCSKPLSTQSGFIFTVHFIHLMGGNDTSGTLEFRDGNNQFDPLLAIIPIRNNTRPQSISTTSNGLYIKFSVKAEEKVEFTIEITTGLNKSYDVNISQSNVYNNSGQGIVIENMRSSIHILNSKISSNGHLAGIHIQGGAGDINITGCTITENFGDGVNISYAGGKKNLMFNSVSHNKGRGIAVFFNSTQYEYEIIQQTEIVATNLSYNLDVAVQIGNYCKNGIVNISANDLSYNEQVGIDFVSCLNETKKQILLIVGFNTFTKNKGLGLKITPAVNIQSEIGNNTFKDHLNGALLIKNYDYEFTERHPVDIQIYRNKFERNEGRFVVNVGLSQESKIQQLNFTKNDLINNFIKEPFASLNPRHRVAAVAVITSSNTHFQLNKMENNKGSPYYLATHLDDSAAEIDASKNWWGVADYDLMYDKVFDFQFRYSLAKINYGPILVTNNYDDAVSSVYPQPKPKTFRIGNELGGILSTKEELTNTKGSFTVTRDIIIVPPGHLRITNGVELEFNHGIGIMVQGEFEVFGSQDSKVKFKLKGLSTRYNDTNLRLTSGHSQYEGRIEIQVMGKWGTICQKGWTRNNAALVCNQLGMVLNAEDWYMDGNSFPPTSLSILRSNVKCTEMDIDIVNCKAEGPDDHSCDHSMDIGVKCVLPTWAGVRYSIAATRSTIRHLIIENSGVFDPNLAIFSPALRFDWNKHQVSDLKIVNNKHIGMEIIYNNPFLTPTINNCFINSNEKYGLKTRTSGLSISSCTISQNKDSGLHYNPAITRKEQKDLFNWFKSDFSNVVKIPNPTISQSILLNTEREEKYFITQSDVINETSQFTVETTSRFVIGIYLLNRPSNETSEEILIYEGMAITPESRKWTLSQNFSSLNDFPVISATFKIHIKYRSGAAPVGNVLFMITAVPRFQYYPTPPINLTLTNITLENNRHGISVRHYNTYNNEEGVLFLRCKNESIKIVHSSIKNSSQEAISINTPYRDPISFAVSEIEYMLNDSSIVGNRYGIYETRRDMRASNNIFHWMLMRNEFSSNSQGGFSIKLPFIRNRKFPSTHTFDIQNNTFIRNNNFDFRIWGHYALLNMSGNVFKDNHCEKGLISIGGMEKEMQIFNNTFMFNYAHYIIEFEMWSHTDKAGVVNGNFSYNTVKNNLNNNPIKNGLVNYPRSYAIGVRGIQRINVTFNLFGNSMDFEILTGILTASLDNYLEVQFNWWGTNDIAQIRQKIFDFDDWNSYAIAKYTPFLNADSFTASLYTPVTINTIMDLDNLGGRLTQSITLYKRFRPYIVRSDLTILPGVYLHIEPGVELQFYPNVGILVLGEFQAVGSDLEPIYMKSFDNKTMWRGGRRKKDLLPLSNNVRLLDGNTSYEGFLEIYNVSTHQWIPSCDSFFTERNAEVICRQLGYDEMDVYVWWGRRSYYVDLNQFKFWPESLQCTGHEEEFSKCELRQNEIERLYQCHDQENFVFIKCGDGKPSERRYWGGIHFSLPKFENTYHATESSILSKVYIDSAGILHSEKTAAVQSFMRSPMLQDISVKNSAFHGINIIAPQKSLELKNYTVVNNLGIGISISILNGETNMNEQSNFYPLQTVTLPYNVFGMVHICDANKEMLIEDRVLLYFKYDNYPVDCVKIFSSKINVKNVGFRLLQINLYNYSSHFDAIPDSIEIYDGNVYNGSLKLNDVLANNSMERHFFKTSGPNMTVYLHASAADGIYGFIAEVVTLPIGVVESSRDSRCNISSSLIKNNHRGAIEISSVGEVSPRITIDKCQMDRNGVQVYHNFTTSKNAVFLDVQNTQYFNFINNMLYQNQGGLKINVDSLTQATKLQGLILNNVFCENKNGPALDIEGKATGIYQVVNIETNLFIHNRVPHSDVILFKQVVFQFKNNVVNNNSGIHIMHLHGFEKVKLTQYQTTLKNSFYMNFADGERYRSTLVVGSAGQSIQENILVNPDNDFELTTLNRSMLDVWDAPVKATNNWWGYSLDSAVEGRIRDKSDAEELLEVTSKPYLPSNASLLSGDCIPGWINIGKSCFYYFGGYMEFHDAIDVCKGINASMPFAEGKEKEFTNYVTSMQPSFNLLEDAFWVQKKDAPFSTCTALIRETIRELPCNYRFSFLCETNPVFTFVRTPFLAEITYIIVIVVVLLGLFLIIIFIVCWIMKSRVRHEQALQRRNSIRSSVRSNRSTLSSAYSGKKLHPSRGPSSDVSSMKYQGSVDSVEKTHRFDSSIEAEYSQDYEVFDTKNNVYSDIEDTYVKHKPLENDVIRATTHPTFDLTFENPGYMDLTRSASHTASENPSSSDDSATDIKPTFHTYQPYKPRYHIPKENMTITLKTPLETAM